jgi:hypothetical protein
MNKLQLNPPLPQSLAIGMAVLSCISIAKAHPYASGITNSAGTIKFILNESADNVKVRFDSGSVTNDLGALAQGVQSFSLGAHTNYQIVVSKVGSGTPSQLSVDSNNFVKFNSPRGVAVNLNPKTRNFGRIYIANSAAGAANGRNVGDGLYVINADQTDCVGQGDAPLNAGVNYGTGGASAPWKLGVGPDDLVYVNDFSTAAATTWLYDPDLSTVGLAGISATNQVFEGIGENVNTTVHTDCASTPVVRGSLKSSNLVIYQIDGSISPWNSIVRYDIGAGPLPWNTPPNAILGNAGIPSVADLTTDLDIGPDGKFYTCINRSAGTDVPSVKVFDTDGTTLLWDSMTAGGTPDVLRQIRAIMISPDGKYLAGVHDDNHVSILPLVNGIPDLANLSTLNFGPTVTIGRDMAWDAADNIVTVSSGQSLLRVYSLGFTTTCVTGNDATGTNGTFQVVTPATTVSVTAPTSFASETGPTPGMFTITRAGVDISGPVTVNYTLTGTASNGVDYVSIPNSVVIAAGQISTNITVTPIDDSVSELTETVVLSLKGGASYSAVAPSTATVTIEDNDAQVVDVAVTAASTMYERITNDYATFSITRRGATNAASYNVTTFVFSGTAVLNVDYVTNGPVTIDPGVVSATFNISPIDNAGYNGNKTITVGLANGAGYSASTNTGTATIIDDEKGPETVLFADSLNSDTSSNNWSFTFMANNLIDDYELNFGSDLASSGVSSAPNGSPTSLRLNVNKDEGSANGAAGINLYPIGQSFSGNFALRFDMNLVQNDGAGTTEFAIFGINHSGTKTNWFIQSGDLANNIPRDIDGLWYAMVGDASGSAPADYVLYTGIGATNGLFPLRTAFASSFTNAFKKPPYSADGGPGSPANKTGSANSIWSDVEVRKIGNVVRMSVNKTVIFNQTNTTAFTNGNIMLGYCDPYASIGAPDGGVFYSNVRVVRLNGPTITSAAKSGSNFIVTFTDDSNDPASAYRLLGSSTVTGTYTNMSATITQPSPGSYSASTPFTAGAKFFRVQHVP